MIYRGVVLGLALLLLTLQYRLWFGDGGYWEHHQLAQQRAALMEQVNQTRQRNQALEAEVQDLKQGLAAIEERARRDLGMIGQKETFFMVVREP